MALINASGEAAMRRTICIGSWTSIRTVETLAMTFDAETRRCIRISILGLRGAAMRGDIRRAERASPEILRAHTLSMPAFRPGYRNVAGCFGLGANLCAARRGHLSRMSARNWPATLSTAAATAGDIGAPISKVPPSIA